MKKYLIIFQQSPFADYSSVEGLELALALSSFEQDVSLLFIDAGILQLLPNKNGAEIAKKDYTKVLEGLEFFDIKQIFIAQDALQKYNLQLENLISSAQTIPNPEVAELISQFDIVLTV